MQLDPTITRQELDPKRIVEIAKDAILVKMVQPPEKVRGFYVPANAKDNLAKNRKKTWKGEVTMLGAEVSFDNYTLKPGEVIHISPEAKECPGFTHGEDIFVIVRNEDALAVEV